MSHGISVISDSGYAQIDQDYSNYVVIASGTGTTSVLYTKPTTDPRAILLVSCDDTQGYIYSLDIKSGVFTPSNQWGVFIEYIYWGDVNTNYVTFHYVWLLPSEAVAESGDQYGMIVYGPTGGRVFSSRQRPLNIAAGIIITPDAYNYYSATYTVPPSDKRRYISISALKIHSAVSYDEGYGPTGVYLSFMVRFNSNSSFNVAGAESLGPNPPVMPYGPDPAQYRHVLVGEI